MTLISDYGLLSDCHSSALVSRDGSIDWWCPGRFDAPSVFGRLLDPQAGHWSIRPASEYEVTRRYSPGSMVIETEFTCATGVLRITDALALGAGERGHGIGYRSPQVLIRELEVLRGSVQVEVDLVPRPEYGLVIPALDSTASGLDIVGGADRLTLTGNRSLEISHEKATGSFLLGEDGEDDRLTFALHHRRGIDPVPAPLTPHAAHDLLQDTIAGWRSWSDLHQGYQGPYKDQVRRSALVLQALTYQPSGAVIAAPTTSLPEKIGGGDNWDYRFGWVRDGSLTLKALWVAACPEEGQRFFNWIAASSSQGSDERLNIMFGAGGEHDLTEHELDHLAGYADSRPVRVGNDAWRQEQLDVLGEVLECAWVLRDQLEGLPLGTAAFLASVADRAADNWQESDSGIWEGREGQRDYLTSKLMCWVALDRAVKLAPRLRWADGSVKRWETVREQVRAAILDRGWSDSAQAFIGAFGSEHLDAGILLLPLVGFLPPDDERVLATLDTIERELATDALVQRWTGSGDEGAFIICSY